jgi:hypothetical protein
MSLVLTVLVVMAHFGTYTYVTPFLRQVTGAGSVTPFLLVYLIYGAAGVVGNFVGGTTVRTRLRGTLTTGPVALTVATALLPAFGTTTVGAMLLLALWVSRTAPCRSAPSPGSRRRPRARWRPRPCCSRPPSRPPSRSAPYSAASSSTLRRRRRSCS